MSGVEHTPWDEIEEPTEARLRSMMESEGLSPILAWANASGEQYAVHKHDYHKVVYCVEGSIWFTLTDEGNRVIELEPGDRLDLPPGIRHGAMVGMDGVTCLEGHR